MTAVRRSGVGRFVVDRAAVDALRAQLVRAAALYEVQSGPSGAEWTAVDGQAPFDWSAPRPLTGPKRFFFPPREPLLRWRGDDAVRVLPEPRPFVLFGVRPCDLAAIAVLDRFFADDPAYARRRAAALLVGLDCLQACAGGFCRDVEAGPFAHAGFDLDLTPLADGHVLVQVGTQRAAALLTDAGVLATPADAAVAEAYATAEAHARDTFPHRPFVGRAVARVDGGEVAAAEWQALGPACFGCTGCTNLCPTCSCFTVVDEPRGDGSGERTRHWDSCLLEGFQREASGHHPAPTSGDRVRRFWLHKLSADFVPALGRIGCVGCGRCDVACPGSIGALRVLAALGAR